jgi:hypothetical protein
MSTFPQQKNQFLYGNEVTRIYKVGPANALSPAAYQRLASYLLAETWSSSSSTVTVTVMPALAAERSLSEWQQFLCPNRGSRGGMGSAQFKF